jgi:hypothetical protein
MLGQDATPEQKKELRESLGLDQPDYVQFAVFVKNAVKGEFGLSLKQGRLVSTLIKERLPATLELALVAGGLALIGGLLMGVYTALRRDSWLSQFLLTVSLIGVSLPNFLIGILLILVFAVTLQWLPSYGRGDVTAIGWWTTGFLTTGGLRALVLPAVTLSLFPMTLIMRLVRSEMLEVLRTRPWPHQPCRALWPCAEEHAGAGDDHYRPAAGLNHCICHRHRDGVPVARDGLSVHPVGAICKYPGDGCLSGANFVCIRQHQPDC